MEQNKPDWSLLRDPKQQSARIELSDDDYAKQAYQFIDTVNLLLQNELQRITTDGQSRADVFWQHNKMHRSTHERGCYGTRVRLLNDCFVAEWYKNIFTKNLGAKPQSRYLAKGKDSLKYPKSCFKTANPLWEKALIEQIEQKYAELRSQAEIIYEIRKLLKRYRRLVDITYGEQHD